jgi:chemotaxis protein MotB
MQFDHDSEESPNQERWMVSFADFMTLLFALFTVLYATSNQDLEKTKEFQESIKRFLIKTGAFGGSGEKINQGEKFNQPIEPPIQTYNQGSPLSQDTFDEAENFVEESITTTDRQKFILDISLDQLGVRITLSGSALYARHTTKFNPDAVSFLDRFGALLTRVGRKVLIEGHVTDEPKNADQFASAWEFSGARATTMARYFIKRHKMDPTLFVPVAFADSRPLATNRQHSERIELVIMTEDLPL